MRRLFLVLLGCALALSAAASVAPGDRPPDALGTTMDGQTVSAAALHGKVVVISFWATWCSYCMKEMPVLANLQTIATERKLDLQVVSVNHREERSTFVRSVRVLRPRLPGLLISWDRNGSAGKPYGTDRGIPVMVMLHRDGTVAHIHVGYDASMLKQLVAEINALLAEPRTAPVAASAATPRA